MILDVRACAEPSGITSPSRRTHRTPEPWGRGRPLAWRPAARLAGPGRHGRAGPWRGYASALVVPLGHATVVVDHFHAIRLANLVVDQVRRRTQQATLGHRGRKRDPLYRIRKPLLTAAEQLTSRGRVRLRAGLAAGDPTGEVAVAWQGKELLRAVYAAGDLAHARAALGRFYRWSDGVGVAELDRPGDLGGSDSWEDAEPCQHSGSIPRSCASARSRWCWRSAVRT